MHYFYIYKKISDLLFQISNWHFLQTEVYSFQLVVDKNITFGIFVIKNK